MRALTARLLGLASCLASAVAIGGCGSAGAGASPGAGTTGGVVASTGWTASLPSGWHELRFVDSTSLLTVAGTMLSNISLPKPVLIPGYPIQASGETLPARGIAVVIASDNDPQMVFGSLPLAAAGTGPQWDVGSALMGGPYLELAGFTAHGQRYVVSVKVGAQASSADLRALDRIVTSIRSRG